jgi:hypothetical protein
MLMPYAQPGSPGWAFSFWVPPRATSWPDVQWAIFDFADRKLPPLA